MNSWIENAATAAQAVADRIAVTPDIGIILGTGLGTVAVSNQISYEAPVFIGDTIAVRVEVAELDADRNRATMAVTWTNQDGTQVASGSMVVKPPKTPISI